MANNTKIVIWSIKSNKINHWTWNQFSDEPDKLDKEILKKIKECLNYFSVLQIKLLSIAY